MHGWLPNRRLPSLTMVVDREPKRADDLARQFGAPVVVDQWELSAALRRGNR